MLCKFRVSAHKLEIEVGRYKNIEVNGRICAICKNGIEDEIHFLLQCPKYTSERIKFLSSLEKNAPSIKKLNDTSMFIWIMSSEDPEVISCLCNYICLLYEKRQHFLDQS